MTYRNKTNVEQTYDTLTGLMDSASFIRCAEDIMRHTQNPQTILFLDIENFKVFNMSYGMHEGNVLLRAVAKLLKDSFVNRVMCRMGDDHFVVICPKMYAEDDLAQFMSGVREDLSYPNIKIKCGMYDLIPGEGIMSGCDKAHIACISVKGNYDTDCAWYDDALSNTLMTQRYVIDHIEEAIDKKWIRPYYQPVVRVMTKKLAGLEALCRWSDPFYGMLRPDQFIETLENAHLIHKLDLAVVEMVCSDIRDMLDEHLCPVPVSINLSRLDFVLCDIYAEVEKIVREYRIPKNLVNIELTERALSEDDGHLRDAMKKFRANGYQLWMDDFGSVYSSLNTLKDYDFDVIKIDMKFLRTQSEEGKRKSRVIISSVVDMAKKLGIHTLCEGVESRENYEFLSEIGCELAQGFLFDKPMVYTAVREKYRSDREEPSERVYMSEVGSVNVLAQNPQEDREESTLPLAFAQYDAERMQLMYWNASFLKFLKEIHINDPQQLDDLFQNSDIRILDQIKKASELSKRDHQEESVDFVVNGRYCSLLVSYIAKDAAAGNEMLMIKAESYNNHSKFDNEDLRENTLRSLYTLFDCITVLDLDEDCVENVYHTNGSCIGYYDGMRVEDSVKAYAGNNIHPMDRTVFCSFMDPHTIRKRLKESDERYLALKCRGIDAQGNYKDGIYILAPVLLEDREMFLIMNCWIHRSCLEKIMKRSKSKKNTADETVTVRSH